MTIDTLTKVITHPTEALAELEELRYTVAALTAERDAAVKLLDTHGMDSVSGRGFIDRLTFALNYCDQVSDAYSNEHMDNVSLRAELAQARAQLAAGAAVRVADQRELLADLCHSQWSGWMQYLFSKCYAEDWDGKPHPMTYIPTHLVERWMRQMTTAYADLPENEKESDRIEADKFIELLSALAAAPTPSVSPSPLESVREQLNAMTTIEFERMYRGRFSDDAPTPAQGGAGKKE